MKTIRVILFIAFGAIAGWSQPMEVRHQLQLKNPLRPDEGPETLEVVQLLEAPGHPAGYRMKLLTDVCEDQVCKILNVTLFWDAVGRYERLEYPSYAPLTKNNHAAFSEADYSRLDQILKDPYSVLGTYSLADIVGEQEAVDAYSGATPSAVQAAVVEGAAYSTWVLWQWTHGEVTEKLRRLSRSHSSPEFIEKCLQSSDQGLVEYALKYLIQTGSGEPRLADAVSAALNRMDHENCQMAVEYLGSASSGSHRLAGLWAEVDPPVREKIIRYFSERENVSPAVLETLAGRLSNMSYYELHTTLILFEQNGFASDAVSRQLAQLAKSDNPFIARRAKEYLNTNQP